MVFLIVLCASILLISFFSSQKAHGCSGLVLGKNISPTGRVLVAHNEDDSNRLLVRHGLIPSRQHTSDSIIIAEEESARIPQTPSTFGLFWTEVRNERGLSNADFFYNDHGVGIFSDSCRQIRADHEPDIAYGGIGYSLRRIIAEQATSANHGVEIAIELIEKYGYRDSGRCYIIADANDAWMVQIPHGQHYCAVRIDDNEAAFIPNHFTIRAGVLENRPFYCSKDLLNYVKRKGWVSAEICQEKELDFAKAFQHPDRWRHPFNTFRHRHALEILTQREWLCDEELPFAIKPEGKITLSQVKAILRSHYENTPDYSTTNFAGNSPHYSSLRKICAGTTIEGIIADLNPRAELTCLWIAMGRPCSQLFIPIHGGVNTLPEEFTPIENPENALEKHCQRDSALLNIDDKNWWNITQRQTCIDLYHEEIHPLLQEKLNLWEKELKEKEEQIRNKAQKLIKEEKKGEASNILTSWARQIALESETKMKEVLSSFPIYVAEPHMEEIRKDDYSSELEIEIPLREEPLENSIRMGQGGLSTEVWARPIKGSLTKTDQGWSLKFRVRELAENAHICRADFWLAGRNINEKIFVAKSVITVK